MGKFFCDCCGRKLDRSEIRRVWDDNLNEIYLYCKYCGGECTDYDLDEICGNDGEEDYNEEGDDEY